MKVFYCSDGLNSYKGTYYASSSEIDRFDGTKTLYDSTTDLANTLSVSSGKEKQDWNMQDLRAVDELTITEESNIKDLSFINDLPNITRLTIKDYEGSLNGIQRAYKLTYLYFDNRNGKLKIDYSGVKGLVTLTELYFINPTNEEVEKLFTEMSKTDYMKLGTLKICGTEVEYTGSGKRINKESKSTFSNEREDGSPIFDLLTTNTKNKIRTLDLSYNIIGDICFKEFTNLSNLLLCFNNLTTVPELEVCNYYKIDLGENSLTDFSLKDKLSITRLYIDGNDLRNLSGILGHSIVDCWATNMNTLDFSLLGDNERIALSSINLLIDDKYVLAFPTKVTIVPTDATPEQFKQIKNSKTIMTLVIRNCKSFSNEDINDVVSTLTNLNRVNFDNTNLNSLDCISDKSIVALSIINTHICDLSPIVDKKIGLFRFNNGEEIINFYNSSSSEDYKTKLKSFFDSVASSTGRGIWIRRIL